MTDNKAAAAATIKRGEELLETVKSDVKTKKAGKCEVSSSLPWLVIWLVEMQLLDLKSNSGNGTKESIKIGKWFSATGSNSVTAVLIVAFLVLFLHLAKIIDLGAIGENIHGNDITKDLIEPDAQ